MATCQSHREVMLELAYRERTGRTRFAVPERMAEDLAAIGWVRVTTNAEGMRVFRPAGMDQGVPILNADGNAAENESTF
jgi:hypothetical protein